MDDKKSSNIDLRARAENLVNQKKDAIKNLSLDDAHSLLHELEVHQVELELQNEELRETQHRLEDLSQKYTDLFDFAPIGYLILDKKGIIKNINLTCCDLLGKERVYIIGKPLSAYMSAGESIILFHKLNDAFKTGTLDSFELILKNKNNGFFTAMLHGHISETDHNGDRECRISLQDVTELRKAQALQQKNLDLQTEKERLLQYLELAPIAFVLLDTDHKVKMINRKGCDLLNRSRQNILDKDWFGFVEVPNELSPQSKDSKFNNNKLLLKPYFEANVHLSNDKFKLVGWHNSTLLDKSGDIIGTLIAGEDITERKKAELSKQRHLEELEEIVQERTHELSDALESEKKINEMKSAFVSVASHELRTPMAILTSSITLIDKYHNLGLFEKEKNHIERIKSSLSNVKNILDDFLSLDQLERGTIRVNTKIINLPDFIEGVSQEISGLLKENQEIIHSHDGEIEFEIDEKILRNILLNLLSNAIKYSEDTITINSHREKNTLTISITDKGIGIPKADQEHMFDRFFRAKNAEHIQGTGLGLSIVQRYLELLGGTIEFKSKIDEGTVFTIVLQQYHKYDTY